MVRAERRRRVFCEPAGRRGRPITVSVESEASSRGAALLALDALGLPPGLAGAPVPAGDRVEPDPRRRDRYREAAARQQRLYAALFGRANSLMFADPT